jgi:hypothetical protein
MNYWRNEMEKYWTIAHGADTTETGCMMHRSYVKTIWKGFPAQRSCEREIIEDFCREKFGKKVVYVQGVAPCLNWNVRESNQKEFENPIPIKWGGWLTETHVFTIEIGDHGRVDVLSDIII